MAGGNLSPKSSLDFSKLLKCSIASRGLSLE